jgi:transcriptional regulator with XRE-family HTH domain
MNEDERRERLIDFLNRRLLEKYGRLSQTRIAQEIGVSQGSLSQYLNGSRLPTGERLHKLAAAFGMEIYDICGVPRRLPDDENLQKIAEYWPSLSEDTKRRMVDMAREKAKEQVSKK